MSFASLVFFLFLPTVFALHYAGRGRRWQNTVLLISSYVFYGWWDYRFCGLMLFASLLDYSIGRAMGRTQGRTPRRVLLGLTLLSNLGLLGFFKYFNFFTDSFALALSALGVNVNTSTLNIVLPVGISFYTFQTLSYTLDIYRGQIQPRQDLLDYLTFVSFFPQLVAGPIERATHLLPQFATARSFSAETAIAGSRLILWGLIKKMVLADNLGGIVEDVFVQVRTASGAELAWATVCFAFQIYCDFSAYSDIATGIANLFGIRLMRNFAYPYFSQSLTEFWRRWHISLSTWFRDYVFIPLGGSRGALGRVIGTIMATFLLSGLWHGAAWHFVAWGAWHGLGLVLERWLKTGARALSSTWVPGGDSLIPSLRAFGGMIRTFFLVCAGWVLFRVDSLTDALDIYRRIGSQIVRAAFYVRLGQLGWQHGAILAGLASLILVEWFGRRHWNPVRFERFPQALRWFLYTALFWGILYCGTRRSADFIYFQF